MQTLRPDIARILEDLRGRIRRYVLIEGLAAVLALLGLAFWLSFGADVAWFQISKLELPLWFRWGFVILVCVLFAGALATWVFFRYLRRFQSKALALVLERRFPQLDDRLVTAVELASSPRVDREGLGGAMLERTVADAARGVESLDLGSVFDSRPLRRAVIAAAVLLASILGFGIANASAMRRWYDAYLGGVENYWDEYRRSEMSVQVVAQPGDRLREFDEDNAYKHPRGADLTLLVTVREGKEVPESVTLRHRSFGAAGTSRGTSSMSLAGERQFRHTIGRVIDGHELWIVGGDFTNRVPYKIQIVDPPKVDRIELDADYPAYTGLEDQPVVVQGAKQSLPMETRFVLRAQANKPLRGVQLRSDRFVLSVALPGEGESRDPGECTLTIFARDSTEGRRLTLPSDAAARLLPGDRRTFVLPMHLSTQADAALELLYAAAVGRVVNPSVKSPVGSHVGGTDGLTTRPTEHEGRRSAEFPVPFPLSPDSKLQIYLEDDDQILSFDPATIAINAVPDAPPVIDANLTGIGQRITRLATVPLRGRILDDYGVMDAWFSHQLDGSEEIGRAPLANPPRPDKKETNFELRRNAREPVERFDVLPLQLEPGRKLSLALNARDGDDLNGPHESQGQVFAFEIVTEDELLGGLYDKEMNLRLRFEHIRDEMDLVRTDLLLHRGRYTDGVKLRANPPADRDAAEIAEELRQIGVAVQASAARGLHLVRKNHAETRDVERQFRDIREELVNNRVDTEASRTRLDQGIIAPLSALNGTGYPQVDELLGLYGLTVEREQDPTAVIDDAVIALDRLIARMDAILAQMSERKDFNEVIQELQAILDRQKKVLEETERERQRSVIQDLFK